MISKTRRDKIIRDMYTTKTGRRIDIGCGAKWHNTTKKQGFEGLDIHDFGQTYVCDVRKKHPRDPIMYFEFDENTFDYMRASHFLEHLTISEAIDFLNDCWVFIKPTGVFHVIVPSVNRNRAYVLTHKSYYTRETFEDLKHDNRWEVYGIRRWLPHSVVENKRGDIHAYLFPLDK